MRLIQATFLTILICIAKNGLAGKIPDNSVPGIAGSIVYTECWFDLKEFGSDATCGKLTVPENYLKPEASTVQLPFIIVLPDELLDPIPLVVAGGGGPGGGLAIAFEDSDEISKATWSRWSLASVDSGRPLVLIDNRGVGSSLPNLNCPEVEKTSIESLQLKGASVAYKLVLESYKNCRDRIIASGVDINQYHIVNAAKDLNEFRKAYEVEQLYVYGISYGTRVALLLENMYPSTIKALILDGVYPLQIDSIEDYPRVDSEALMRVFDLCESDQYCSERTHENIINRFEEYLAGLQQNPLTIRITLHDTLETIDIIVTPGLVINSILVASYDKRSISLLPLFIESMVGGATDYLSQLIRDWYVYDIRTSYFDEAAYYAYNCFEETPFNSIDTVFANLSALPFSKFIDTKRYAMEFAICDYWDSEIAHVSQKTPAEIRSPVLMLSGLLDPVTPHRYASALENSGDNIYHLKWNHISHGVMYVSACSGYIAALFLRNPTQNPDDDCREEENSEGFEFTFY